MWLKIDDKNWTLLILKGDEYHSSTSSCIVLLYK